MDAETIRLLATGFFTLAASLGTAWFTTRAQTKNAREQRVLDERKWQHEHVAEIFASVSRTMLELKSHIHGVVYEGKRHEDQDVLDGQRLTQEVDAELSRLLFVAPEEVTAPAYGARVACRELYRIARARLQEELPEHADQWNETNHSYGMYMEAYRKGAVKTLKLEA